MITGALHWYVAYSFINSATVIDGGDHIASILAFLLLPVTLTDTRKWHWSMKSPMEITESGIQQNLDRSIVLDCDQNSGIHYIPEFCARKSIGSRVEGRHGNLLLVHTYIIWFPGMVKSDT